MKWLGLLATIALIVSCFYPWVFIEQGNIVVSGINADGTTYGKPGYFHFLMSAFYLSFYFTPRIWAKRMNLLIGALNLGWAIRNYFIISACAFGECPQKKWALYVTLISSIFMLVAALFPQTRLMKKQ